MTVYRDYTEGQVTPAQALRALAMELGEVESELAPLEAQRARLRDQIAIVLTRIDGEQAAIPGFGTVRMVSAGTTERWDGKALEALAAQLRADGNDALAETLLNCKTRSMRAGGLRIEREKEGGGA